MYSLAVLEKRQGEIGWQVLSDFLQMDQFPNLNNTDLILVDTRQTVLRRNQLAVLDKHNDCPISHCHVPLEISDCVLVCVPSVIVVQFAGNLSDRRLAENGSSDLQVNMSIRENSLTWQNESILCSTTEWFSFLPFRISQHTIPKNLAGTALDKFSADRWQDKSPFYQIEF